MTKSERTSVLGAKQNQGICTGFVSVMRYSATHEIANEPSLWVGMKAVVLGGGRNDPLAVENAAPAKSLIPVNGLPMANHVLRALRGAGVREIVYVGPSSPSIEPLVDEVVADEGDMLQNLQRGLDALDKLTQENPLENLLRKRVLVVTADVPMLTADAVLELMRYEGPAALVYPVVPEAAMQARFPGGKRTYAQVKEGRFTGGNVFLLDPGLVPRFLPKLRQVIDNRKNPLALAGILGWNILSKYITRQLTIAELEARVSDVLGVQAKSLVTEHAEIAFDIDKTEDLELVRRLLGTVHAGNANDGGGS